MPGARRAGRSAAGAYIEPDPSWRARAACLGTDPDDWVRESGPVPAALRRICGSCEVRRECLDLAVRERSLRGVWAATSWADREALRRGGAA